MSPADPKWLEILKASGWQTAALTVAFALFVVLVRADAIPTTNSPLWIALPSLAVLVFGALTAASIGDSLFKAINPTARLIRWIRLRQEQKRAQAFIPYMTSKDKEIIGYLLHHNQKMFQADLTGGYAAPLISKQIIRRDLQHRQAFDNNHVPFSIPDHIWVVLKRKRKSFPYKPPVRNTKSSPWAIPWQAR